MLNHWEVCDRKMPFTISLKECQNILQKVFDNYGQRALLAETNQGVDWKAMSHAIRVGEQAIELVTTKTITFPRLNADRLLAIKQGKFHYKMIAEELENLLEKVEIASKNSDLLEKPDIDFMENLVYKMHTSQMVKEWTL